MYINAVANRHNFYNIIFKTKYKLYTAIRSAPSRPMKKIWVLTWSTAYQHKAIQCFVKCN